ncbi:hypoxia-inducible factor 1 alpha [Plakobranchus ocellatus]|uniref:Hypoxia-inducible factor 1 alpha n=1 Tax=Plakobranchus ocellatus TaxID=259542 RepID=A0AAV4BB12_9GAST|nr:hypoxia-inducible factor 1 alpha [Plakobranchus ocellatus]
MAKDKRRNSEKRKEKSRDAARCRRGKESEIFSELAQSLPLAESVTGQLDKASIMRLSISMLKIYNILLSTDQLDRDKQDDDDHDGGGSRVMADADTRKKQSRAHSGNSERWDHLYQKALDGFAFILSHDGDIVYLSESVGKYLGLQQIELIGQSIYEFAHPCDHEEIKEMLTPKHSEATSNGNSIAASDNFLDAVTDGRGMLDHEESRRQLLRLKCTLTSKGRNVNLKSASFKPMKFTGCLLVKNNAGSSEPASLSSKSSGSSPDSDDDDLVHTGSGSATGFPFLVGVAEPIPHPSNIEVPLGSQTFLSKHSMDMHFLFCDERIEELAGYNSEEMVGKSIYDFYHGLDCDNIERAFKDLFSKGQTMTEPYRFLAKEGGYLWVVTQATVINNSRTLKPQSVVCVHYVVSGVEEGSVILSHVQEPPQADKQVAPLLDHLPPKVELSTENIFAPKPKDMNESYFIPPELKDTITLLNEEPTDLSYLAPNAGDDFLPVVFSDRDALLSPDPSNLKQEPDFGPDMAYRKNLSPASILSSNSSSRIGSPKEYLNMPLQGEVVSMDTFFQSMNKLNTVDDKSIDDEDSNGNIDFSGRAPYIPMDSSHDLGLCPPSSGVLFTLSEDLNPGLFGQTEHVFGPKQSLFEQPPQPPKRSIQDMLGGSTTVASIERPADTMYLQMKRPLDMNSLEKGPPRAKFQRLEQVVPQQQQQQLLEQVVPQHTFPAQQPPSPIPPSILQRQRQQQQQQQQQQQHQQLAAQSKRGFPVYQQTVPSPENRPSKDSLLLNLLLSGEERNYSDKMKSMSTDVRHKKMPHQLLLPNLTTQECEVNAPASANRLLQGRELLSALDVITRPGLISSSDGRGPAHQF